MSRKPRLRVKSAQKKRSPAKTALKPSRKTKAKPAAPDELDVFIAAAAKALTLPARKAWLPAIKANLRVTLQLAATVTAFKLPDDAEPAPVFRA